MDNNFSISSLLLSLVALFISGWSASIAWRNSRRDRSDLRIHLKFNPKSGNGSRFLAICTNHGRRSVIISKAILKTNRKENKYIYHFGDSNSLTNEQTNLNSPIQLDEGHKIDFTFLLYSLKHHHITHPLQIKQLIIYDTKNKKYKYPSWKPKSLISNIRMRYYLRYKFDNWLTKSDE